jgi:hypothetical protein
MVSNILEKRETKRRQNQSATSLTVTFDSCATDKMYLLFLLQCLNFELVGFSFKSFFEYLVVECMVGCCLSKTIDVNRNRCFWLTHLPILEKK